MRKVTKEDMKALSAYSRQFNTAIYSRYVTGLTRNDMDILERLYYELLGMNLNRSCNSCVMKMMRALGHIYTKNIEDIELWQEEEKD